MNTKLLTLFTRTPLHVGAGASVGAVDQPIVRERHTRFPVIPGSSLKGVLADLWLDDPETGKKLFGTTDHAGSLLIGESNLLAFPVRSAAGCFAYVTCPLALERFKRDTGYGIAIPKLSNNESVALPNASILGIDGQEKVVFEEYPLTIEKDHWEIGVDSPLEKLSDDAAWKGDGNIEPFGMRLAVISDELFQYFVENACEIAQHNRIDDDKGVVEGGALFNQENVPSETLFYCVLHAKEESDFVPLVGTEEMPGKLAVEKNLLQIGADITTGLGWCSVKLQGMKKAE